MNIASLWDDPVSVVRVACGEAWRGGNAAGRDGRRYVVAHDVYSQADDPHPLVAVSVLPHRLPASDSHAITSRNRIRRYYYVSFLPKWKSLWKKKIKKKK